MATTRGRIYYTYLSGTDVIAGRGEIVTLKSGQIWKGIIQLSEHAEFAANIPLAEVISATINGLYDGYIEVNISDGHTYTINCVDKLANNLTIAQNESHTSSIGIEDNEQIVLGIDETNAATYTIRIDGDTYVQGQCNMTIEAMEESITIINNTKSDISFAIAGTLDLAMTAAANGSLVDSLTITQSLGADASFMSCPMASITFPMVDSHSITTSAILAETTDFDDYDSSSVSTLDTSTLDSLAYKLI